MICGLLVCTGNGDDRKSGGLTQGHPTSNSWEQEEDEIIKNI